MKYLLLLPLLLLLPSNSFEIKKEPIMILANITAYSSSIEETDSDPYLMASGKQVYEGAMANNCLPFGTKVLFEGIEFTIEDRKNKRYGCEWFDIWMPVAKQAKNFGILKDWRVEIIK